LTDDEGEARELTEKDLSQFVPFTDLPAELQKLLSEPKRVVPETQNESPRKPAA
jgi:hypothetical protein